MRKALISMMFVFSALILPGCWNRTELNELRITTATGVDLSDGKWLISYQTIVPSTMASGTGGVSGGAGQPAIHVFSVRADTFNKARNLSNLETSRRLYIAHNKVVLIGKEAAAEGIGQLIDTYLRSTEARETVYILVTDGRANEFLRKLVPPEKLPGASYGEILDKETELVSIFPKTSIYDFALHLHSDSKSIGVPVVTLFGEDTIENKEELESLDVLKKTSQPLKMTLSQLAIFQKDKLVGWLNRQESLGLSWLTDKIKGAEISFPCSDNEKNQNSITVISSKTKLKPIKSDDHYTMHVKIKANGILMESVCNEDLSKPEVISGLQKNIEEHIKNDINASWDALQRLGADTTGFAEIIHRKYPKEWKEVKDDWENEFKKMEVKIEVSVIIKRPGLIQKSFNAS
ncbi:spore gernimation protein GerC [Paenibacillus sp. IHB B 3415]|uniref:Ger(x)C family spore germination protein n=1 Tax=Paenibacillus sp. IHB B 3415 TaxID=867080 RepID=UPI000574623C|nr:Ger(x)C family spore germination protein [Paenibacillus sp. IHB B 3415]KHL95707.1 spore gernimation protein GerC [Paenibacillus sp. IHB B 3415]